MSQDDKIWEPLHDATLESIDLKWASGELVITLRKSTFECPSPILIKAINTSELTCPRRFPWGESVSINEIRGSRSVDGDMKILDIEIQSGDVIHFEATDIILL